MAQTYTDKYGTIRIGNRGRGRPMGSKNIKKYIKTEVKKDIKQQIHAGRPHAQIESLRVISGHIRVKRAKSRMVKVGSKECVV